MNSKKLSAFVAAFVADYGKYRSIADTLRKHVAGAASLITTADDYKIVRAALAKGLADTHGITDGHFRKEWSNFGGSALKPGYKAPDPAKKTTRKVKTAKGRKVAASLIPNGAKLPQNVKDTLVSLSRALQTGAEGEAAAISIIRAHYSAIRAAAEAKAKA